jgi:hypothetical protein
MSVRKTLSTCTMQMILLGLIIIELLSTHDFKVILHQFWVKKIFP